ncbi:TPA: integrase [Legionella pneumophila]|nr:integrase [Legionella pneumophila]HAU1138395.1 integrase [Legionella pneumophila]HAW6245160.1 integrase [Legionella pneumophila]
MSNKLRSAIYSVHQLIKQMQGYSYASKADMKHMINHCMKDLHELGFKVSHLNGLKPKHIYVLVEHWKKQGKSPATIKNYMSKLRKLAYFLDKPKLVKTGNDSYQIDKRTYIPNQNKAIHHIDLNLCTDPHIRLSLEAQMLFGLRREESMKFIISEAWHGDCLYTKPSWTKGGIGRLLKITNEEQMKWLLKVSQQIKPGESLTPKERTYKQHLSHYQQQAKLMNVNKLHGLRHSYAQRRYVELTKNLDPLKIGLLCPIAGGKTVKELHRTEKQIDRQVREIISRELGHSRLNITRTYLG